MQRGRTYSIFCCIGVYSAALVALHIPLYAQFLSTASEDSAFVRNNYTKAEVYIPMRDGTKLFTTIYTPKDASEKNKYPIIMQRTCYSVEPYGADKYEKLVSPSRWMMREKYIVVYQDVRGRWMSEGKWTNMTPHIPVKRAKTDVDEASDTYDTIEWLIKNVKYNNGRVGQWGISYPGFYTIAGALAQHPALKASSPQAPIADFFFDDFHHNGAMTLGYFFAFPIFGVQKTKPTTEPWYTMVQPGTRDIFQFLLDAGPLSMLTERFYKDNVFWQEMVEHPNYDEFWQKRAILPHLKNVKHAVMTVGGWFDAEDLYGPLNIYKTLEKNNPGTYNILVMGPFGHGDWSRERGHYVHSNIYFGDSLATFYQREIEARFFRHFLKEAGDGKTGLPEAYLFDTGKKIWRTFNEYPPKAARQQKLYLHAGGKLAWTAPDSTSQQLFSEYSSDPAKPVPHTEDLTTLFGITMRNYMTEDQRFAAKRPDVLVFQTDTLTEDVTLCGEITAALQVATTGTDADWVVKLIDVYPGWEPNHPYMPHKNIILGGYQQMVRSEIMRSRFRKSFEKPEPMVPGEITPITFRLQDVFHTFKKGHRIMIQVQSTWFPAFDRNPQRYVDNIYKAKAEDFIKATHRVYHSKDNPSYVQVSVID
ncbi:MAG: CocE/NonD family hydrolase [Bacteroidota bacterium]|nr:CocE/NonD family hydrolase [Candidatus Kapabacteria bacterium]MDW8220375.1 CocE/NonD family hydrolase [Bacteroidota bacterium]